jgi:hypothetical protein
MAPQAHHADSASCRHTNGEVGDDAAPGFNRQKNDERQRRSPEL